MYTPPLAFPLDAWVVDEPRLSTLLTQVVAKAARHPYRTLAVATGATILMLAVLVATPPSYEATLTLRMAEGHLQDSGSAPKPPARIREYISDVAMTHTQLLDVMEKNGLSDRFRQADPIAATNAFRDDIEIAVNRNYFLFDDESTGALRSAEVVLRFTAGSPDQAQAVVHDIGTIFLESQEASRRTWLKHAREANDAEARRLDARLRFLQDERSRLLRRESVAASEDVPAIRAEIESLLVAREGVLYRAGNIQRRTADLDFALAAERSRLGLDFLLVDESVKALRKPLGGVQVVGYAALMFSVLLGVSAILLGAFDRWIYRGIDVTVRGFPVLGVVAHFPGDDVGPLLSRHGPNGASISRPDEHD